MNKFSKRVYKFESFTYVCFLAIIVNPSACLSVVSNVRAPYSSDWNFRQCFYAIWYLCHPLTSRKPGEPSVEGRGV